MTLPELDAPKILPYTSGFMPAGQFNEQFIKRSSSGKTKSVTIGAENRTMPQEIALPEFEFRKQPTTIASVVTEQWQKLCAQLTAEEAPERLTALICEINELRFSDRR
jgi:hypothetical protein